MNNTMKKVVVGISAVIVVVALAGLGAWYLMNQPAYYTGTLEPITIGNLPYEYSTLIYIADEQGFFTGNGLNVTLRNYDTTVASIKGMENAETDISSTTEYSIVTEAFNKENISAIGCIDKYQLIYLIGRKDHGVKNISDLKGKKIGATRGTIGEFYLGRFLDLHGINIQDITLVDVQPSQYVDALVNGSVDSVVAAFKFVDPIKEQSGSNIVIWPTQSSQKGFLVLACRNDWAASHHETIEKFLKSLDQAEKYIINHPAEATAIVQKRLNFSDANIAAMWPNNQYSLSLDQSLITAMEDEGRWMIANNLTTEKGIPDFRNYIYTKGLKEVKPEAVSIIG